MLRSPEDIYQGPVLGEYYYWNFHMEEKIRENDRKHSGRQKYRQRSVRKFCCLCQVNGKSMVYDTFPKHFKASCESFEMKGAM